MILLFRAIIWGYPHAGSDDALLLGDVVRVAPGYARNFLLPRGLAAAATEDNKRQIARRAARLALEEAEKTEEVAAAVAALSESP